MPIDINQEFIRKSLGDLLEPCWTVCSHLESQISRNPGLPENYRENLKRAFEALRRGYKAIERNAP